MKNKSKKGFTLVEIMIVVVIIGLLAALAIPAFSKVRENAVESTLANDARQLSSAANQYFLETSQNTVTIDDLLDTAGGGANAYLSPLSKGVVFNGSDVLTAGPNNTFTLSHPNYNGNAPVTYFVDTGRAQEAAEEEE